MYMKKMAGLLIILCLIFGCSMKPKEAVISLAITCSDDSVGSFQVSCIISDVSGNRIDTKTFKIEKDKKEFWTRYALSVPRSSQVELDAIGKNSENKLYKAESKKVLADKVDNQSIYLSLEEPKTSMDKYKDATVKVSGNINCADYKGKIEIHITAKGDQNKAKFAGDFPPIAAKTIIDCTGDPVDFYINVPLNLGPSVICFFRLQKEEPPFCQDIDIGSSDIQGISFQR